MTLFADMDNRFRHLLGKVALFVFLAIFGIGVVVVWTGIKKGAFTPKSSVYFVADSGEGLKEDMPVKFSGFKVGQLNTLALDEQGKVVVEIQIENRHLHLLRRDAVVTLRKEGVIGDGVLDIRRGSEGQALLVAGGRVGFERSSGLEQAVVEVKNRAMPILDDLHHTLSDPQGDVHLALENIRTLSAELTALAAELRVSRTKLDAVLEAGQQGLGTLNTEMPPLLQAMRQSAQQTESATTQLNQALPGLLKQTRGSLENIRLGTETLNRSVQQTAPQLPELMGEARVALGTAREVMDSTQQVMDGLNTLWLFRKGGVPEQGAIGMDSHD